MLLYVTLVISLSIGFMYILWMIWDAWRRRYWKYVVAGVVLTFLIVMAILGLLSMIGGK